MSPAELHLPDLPDVPVQLGRARPAPEPRPPLSMGYRLRRASTAYLPLLLMALLALSTWWLVKNTPRPPGQQAPAAPRQLPDYTMTDFSVTRFDPDGRMSLRIDGDTLRHFPDTDRLEIDGARIHAIGADGRITDASARHALSNGDGSEVQLIGDAQVTSQLEGTETVQVRSEFLHAFARFERLRSHLPVRVLRGGSDIRAGGIDYDNMLRRLVLPGPVHAVYMPARRSALPAGAPREARR